MAYGVEDVLVAQLDKASDYESEDWGFKSLQGLIIFNQLYDSGADPLVIIQDLLDVVHWISRVTVTPEVISEPGISEIDKKFRNNDLWGLLVDFQIN